MNSPKKGHLFVRTSLPVLTAMIVALAASVVLTLAGCASSQGISPHAEPLPAGQLGMTNTAATPLAADWWKGFGDNELNGLVQRALAGSPSLHVAQARLLRAQAGIEAAHAAQGVRVDGEADAMRQRYSETGIYPPPLAGGIFSSGNVQATASWELDFFGRHRTALDAALGAGRAAEADGQAARVLIASSVVRAYVQLSRWLAQREVAGRTLAQRSEVLILIHQRVDAGLDTTLDLRQGEGALPEARQQLEAIDEQIVLARHSLAALTAQAPNALDGLAPPFPAVQSLAFPASVPADLVGRRADIQAARWRVEAATHDVANARSQFYPNINLTALVGLNSIGLDKLFKAGSEQYGAGPAIHLPIFDAGSLRANLRGKSADLDAAVETYNGAVIDAVHDVADQISSLQYIERQRLQQDQAQVLAEAAYGVAVQRYKAGLGSYLAVLSAESNVIAQRRSATDLKARVLDTQVALIRALGGGYVADSSQAATERGANAPL
ncbi:MAG TPA: efflux transporter outer membrane subunit [Rhizobacter sp.]|nr:efflux transporter outer membrane subunit [Rhizobacter sp.]